jgi:hypothetical protein
MKHWRRIWAVLIAVGISVVLAFHSSAAGGEVAGHLETAEENGCTQVPLTTPPNDSATAGFVRISGSVSLCEVRQGDELNYWAVGSFDLANSGKQTGVAVAAAADLLYPHGQRSTLKFEIDDSLLGTGIFKAGKALSFKVDPPAKTLRLRSALSSNSPSVPEAVGRVTYLELGDGTSRGVPPRQLVQTRTLRLAALSKVESAYLTGGEAAFLSAIQKRTGMADMDFLLHGIAGTQRLRGTENAVSQLREHIEHTQSAELRTRSAGR